jgi:RNA polymerase sigma factor (sigma-70 family)
MTVSYALNARQRGEVERHLDLAHYWASRCRTARRMDPDDRLQVAFLGLMRAVVRFDPGRGIQFSTYASHCILRQLSRAARSDGMIKVPYQATRPDHHPGLAAAGVRAHRVYSLARPGRDDRPYDPASPADDHAAEVAERVAAVREAIEALPARLWYVVRERLRCRTLASIAQDMGVGRQRAQQLEVQSHEMLRIRLARFGR